MSTWKFIRTALMGILLSFAGSQASFGATPQNSKATSKVDAKKTKVKAKTKAKKANALSKEKVEKKVNAKTESKSKLKQKNTATKKPTVKEPKKLATADTFNKDRDSSFSILTVLFYVAIVLGICALCFAVWLDYRPTVYPSGKVYGPLEYLQGPFTTEINASLQAKVAVKQTQSGYAAEPKKANQAAPITVTREPVVNRSAKDQKTGPAAKAS
jgi:hypothetical protein